MLDADAPRELGDGPPKDTHVGVTVARGSRPAVTSAKAKAAQKACASLLPKLGPPPKGTTTTTG
jgi:hypothetical protein